ncbi:helix-turn-helix transcriptional regulator [Streptomyces calidiresistens]|uniref:Helix-turn-helix domain-containing protein n=1 Tax=Streptomyces calidiresistens TaxID=1485586 RepID=A0A7W3T4M0_9ACTN|nr:helix-turn-helix transcriptional regulator [Streptomyces calidiresistens]MBB0230837.1 helix-turn-helix domain-containing protein [Streptomyces calidiresistens]
MPPRAAPSARQRRLGTELRKMRERAGMSPLAAAEALGTNRTGISNLEAGRFGISEERLRTLAAIYSCTDRPYIDALAKMATLREKGWWEHYRESMPTAALSLAELEHHTRRILTVQILHIPGILQTEEYAKGVLLSDVPRPEPTMLRQRLSFRMRRRDVLDKNDPPHCMFLIHEAALRFISHDPVVALGQAEYLRECSERHNVTIRAIPFNAGIFPNTGISTVYAAGDVERLDTVHLEVPHGNVLLDAESHLEKYRAILKRVQEISLTPQETMLLIESIIHTLRKDR